MPLPDDDEELEAVEEQPEEKTFSKSELTKWLSLATSIAGLTAIAILTFEMVMGTIKFGTLMAYLVGTAFMVGLLILMLMGFQWAHQKIEPGLGRWAFWLISSPLAFFYYLLVAWLVYAKLARLLIKFMGDVLLNAPGGQIPG